MMVQNAAKKRNQEGDVRSSFTSMGFEEQFGVNPPFMTRVAISISRGGEGGEEVPNLCTLARLDLLQPG